MKRAISMALGASAALVAGMAIADEIAPADVKFVDGAINESLTGVPGDPAEGAKVLGQRSLGNCVACHQVSALSDVAWHGEICSH